MWDLGRCYKGIWLSFLLCHNIGDFSKCFIFKKDLGIIEIVWRNSFLNWIMYVCNNVCVSFKEITTKRKTETEHCKKNIIWHLCRTVVYIFKLLFFLLHKHYKFLFKFSTNIDTIITNEITPPPLSPSRLCMYICNL